MKTIDFSTVPDGKAKATEVIAKSGLAIASFHALEAYAGGSSFPSQTEYINEVHARLGKKAEKVVLAHGEDSIV